MKYILWLWVIAWILYLIATSKPAIMAPCNTWVWDIYYKCNTQQAGEPDHIQLGDCKDYLTGKDLDDCINLFLSTK